MQGSDISTHSPLGFTICMFRPKGSHRTVHAFNPSTYFRLPSSGAELGFIHVASSTDRATQTQWLRPRFNFLAGAQEAILRFNQRLHPRRALSSRVDWLLGHHMITLTASRF